MGFEEKAEAKVTELGGKAKEALGNITGDKDLAAEGKADQGEGKVKEFLADAQDKVDNVAATVKESAKRLTDKVFGDDK
ncbi:CsbD family protein [Arcanobacterium wilhelmae]|uniref:CsbD family protein n=1 Tax=Arcanobacterium wilhelmae TaxID=1803177 RepID=UPI00241504C8|nr:CsbD family protein [Arcanobacterium wilhelmae]WFN90135.1 CsbD family protein [Arcanobacterium wilhelmae]